MTNDPFQMLRNDMYGWAFRILGRHHDALDVVQDVFVRWNRHCQADYPASPRAWLRRVTVNCALDAYRKQCRTPTESVDDWAPLEDQRNAQRAPTFDGATTERHDELIRAMAACSETQRFVLAAKIFDEQSFASIARDMDLAPSTVKTHYVRGLQNLRDYLEGQS
ncbi:MAG: RNA polymerase sigma factor [Phycisphaerae bacterium]